MHETIEVNIEKLKFDCRVAGNESDELAIFLHGFPETSFMWKNLILEISKLGFYCVAPNLRGYSKEACPNGKKNYTLDKLANDVIDIAKFIGQVKFHLIGHDWGAGIGWKVVHDYPNSIWSWTGLSVPHLQAFGEAMVYDKEQSRMSHYIKSFQWPFLGPAPIPIPPSKEVSASIMELLSNYDIEFLPKHIVTELDVNKKQAMIEGHGSMEYDLFMGVPIHRPPKVVLDSVLGKNGWIKVDRNNLRTEFENVYAIGDVTHIPAGDFAVPKAGTFAEDAGRTVVVDLLNRIKDENNQVIFHGIGTCYLEMGSEKVAKVEANFLGGEKPQLEFIGLSKEYKADKMKFETSRIKKWFNKTTHNN